MLVELELELEVVVEEPDGVIEVVVVEALVELLESGVQVSVSDVITPVIGRLRFEIGVPGGTLTLNVYVFPPTTVTVIVHASADAEGSAAAANATSRLAVSKITYSSFRLLLNGLQLLRRVTMCAS